MRSTVAALAVLLLAAGCGGAPSPESWSAAVALPDPLRPPAEEPLTKALDGTSRVAVTLPRVYRVQLRGKVSRDGLATEIAVGGWLLVVAPYPTALPATSDENVVDLGLVTDTSPLDGRPGALWFGSHTSVMGDLDLGGVTPNAGPVDLVDEEATGDLLVAQLEPQVAPLNPLNLFDVDEGGPLGAVTSGTVQLRFDADARNLVGRIDFADPASGAEYHADLSGTATS